MTTDDVVGRIRKLLRLAQDTGATEAEAASALEHANALLIRHNLTMDHVAVTSGEKPPITEQQTRVGRAGNWRGTLLGILARHNLCSAIASRSGKVDTVVVVGRPANVQATHAMYDWIAAQLERFAQEEWQAFNAEQREVVSSSTGVPWCPECQDWTETYSELGYLQCYGCDRRVLPERPLIHGFTWKTAFLRGALLRISNRLYQQRKAQQQPGDTTTPATPAADAAPPAGSAVTALVVRTEQENADYIRQHFGETRKGRARSADYHAAAFHRGEQRGSDVSLTPISALRGRPSSALPRKGGS